MAWCNIRRDCWLIKRKKALKVMSWHVLFFSSSSSHEAVFFIITIWLLTRPTWWKWKFYLWTANTCENFVSPKHDYFFLGSKSNCVFCFDDNALRHHPMGLKKKKKPLQSLMPSPRWAFFFKWSDNTRSTRIGGTQFANVQNERRIHKYNLSSMCLYCIRSHILNITHAYLTKLKF